MNAPLVFFMVVGPLLGMAAGITVGKLYCAWRSWRTARYWFSQMEESQDDLIERVLSELRAENPDQEFIVVDHKPGMNS